MEYMFHNAGHNNSNLVLNLSNFDLSSTTNMSWFLYDAGARTAVLNKTNFRSDVVLDNFVDQSKTFKLTVKSTTDKALLDAKGIPTLIVTVG